MPALSSKSGTGTAVGVQYSTRTREFRVTPDMSLIILACSEQKLVGSTRKNRAQHLALLGLPRPMTTQRK